MQLEQHVGENGVMCSSSNQTVEIPVEQHHLLNVILISYFCNASQHVANCNDLGRTCSFGRQADRKRFVQKPCFDNFDNFIEINRPHDNSLARLNIDKAFAMQSVERLMNRRPADLQSVRNGVFT